MSQIQMHCPYQGASFGGWSQMAWNTGGHYCAALAAAETGRPVKWLFSAAKISTAARWTKGSITSRQGRRKTAPSRPSRRAVLLANTLFPLFGVVQHSSRIPASPTYGAR